MDTEVIKKVINGKFDKIEEKVNVINDKLSERINPQNIETVYAYISGFFDGEGNISVNKQSLTLFARITNTNLDILKRIKYMFKGEVYVHTEKSELRKKSWIWYISDRNDIKFFLEMILPYSTVKKSQILLGLEFLKNTTDARSSRGMSLEERKYREYMHHKFKEPKHRIYTEDEIKHFDEQIKNTIKSQRDINESVYAYISGFFDAEGCIDTDKINDYIYLQARLANTYPNILIGTKQVFGGNVNKIKKSQNRRQKWVWRSKAKDDVKFFLTKISKYSIVKKSQINLGFKFLETNNYQTKLLIADKLKELKDEEYTNEEICSLNDQIKEMNVNKFQHTMEDYT